MLRRYAKRTCVVTVSLLAFTSFFILLKIPSEVNVMYTTESAVKSHTGRNSKHVTKSMAELGRTPELSAHTLLFNRIPNSGSEMLVFLLQRLQYSNNFLHVRLMGNQRAMTTLEQEKLVSQVTNIIRDKAVPLSFDSHVHFVNFSSFDQQSPTYINLIRDPIEKLNSKFYSKENFNKKNAGGSLDDCVLMKQPKCTFNDGVSYDLTIPYFCGQDLRCTLFNNKWALSQAKANVERYFPVVGILEELNTTLEVFANAIPYFFNGAQKVYVKELLRPHNNINRKKSEISSNIRNYLKKYFVCEYDFYEWIKKRLFHQLQILYGHA